MKKIIIAQIISALLLMADVTLTPQEEKNWQIQTALGKEVTHVPLDEYMMRVTTPPKLLHTISLPYEAKVIQLSKANFQSVNKGEVLALLNSPQWVEAQKEAISALIKLTHSESEASRKSKLCKEEIIAQKECITAEAEVKTDKIKLLSSKAVLKSYGATDEMIKTLFKDLAIFPNIELRSAVKGIILQTDIETGKNISSSNALFVIKTDGEDWLEGDIPQAVATALKPSQEVIIKINDKEIKSKVLLMSPTLNSLNQTRYVRFSLPKEAGLLAGLRAKVELSVERKAFVIDKKALIQNGADTMVFIKKGQTYHTLKVIVLAENREVCYLDYNAELKEPIAISATSILQNKLQQGE
ncbi:MAG: efflux RND transporter periplasmic adaptor subunit [Sulfurimonas sp.]|uniref:efflux RND transporter periplasmic adaptor subunit n=1 Tax=Sulfurimonas sp. TaxID=2022749 RepID=UPI002637FF8A|nr:efflux RND transporter periplasmic adaptor subunit [Sulfurimonas sp.]MDD5372509.1 efflux RND transporter periplasmic adaptor subunit [Sulfurimonas sp.]